MIVIMFADVQHMFNDMHIILGCFIEALIQNKVVVCLKCFKHFFFVICPKIQGGQVWQEKQSSVNYV